MLALAERRKVQQLIQRHLFRSSFLEANDDVNSYPTPPIYFLLVVASDLSLPSSPLVVRVSLSDLAFVFILLVLLQLIHITAESYFCFWIDRIIDAKIEVRIVI
ncbi:hypothetical protein L1887_18210 [Cichorium endivia]|nr:hypothetical protein L1887_18210 [Cichorium endivia]